MAELPAEEQELAPQRHGLGGGKNLGAHLEARGGQVEVVVQRPGRGVGRLQRELHATEHNASEGVAGGGAEGHLLPGPLAFLLGQLDLPQLSHEVLLGHAESVRALIAGQEQLRCDDVVDERLFCARPWVFDVRDHKLCEGVLVRRLQQLPRH